MPSTRGASIYEAQARTPPQCSSPFLSPTMDPQRLAQMMFQMGLNPADLAGMMSQFNANASTNGPGPMGDLLRGITTPRRSGAATPRDDPPSLSFHSSVEEVTAYKEWLLEESKKPPVPGPVVPRDTLLAGHEMGRRKQEAEECARDTTKIHTRFTVIGFPKHSCMAPLHDLKPSTSCMVLWFSHIEVWVVKCSEMLMRKTHTARIPTS